MDFDEVIEQLIAAPTGLYVCGRTDDGEAYAHTVIAFVLYRDKFSNQHIDPVAVDAFGDAYNAAGMELRSVYESRYIIGG